MRFGLTANVEVPNGPRLAKIAYDALKGKDVVLEHEIAKEFGKKGTGIENMDVDILIAVGGDGTILRALQHNEAPIFGINAGELGFLTEVGEHQIVKGLKRVIEGDYLLDERIKLKTTVGGRRYKDATNETVVHTAHIAKIRHFRVYVDDQLAIEVRADGIIVSTPTGSTCYAMSVGAPILDPRVDGLVIAPMAPFKFAGRPTVVPASSDIRLELLRPNPCVAVIDGQEEVQMDGGESVHFTRSEKMARFVSFGRSFYARTREELMGGPC
ncbi:MAG: NAD(+)/NADH kinase [Methanomassiliicoccales archaeon]